MALYRLAVVLKKELSVPPPPTGGGVGDGEILVVRQEPPPALAEEEYQRYVDSDLWDLPSAPLRPLEGGAAAGEVVVEGADSCAEKLDLRRFDVRSAIDQVMCQVGLQTANNGHWVYCKLVEEPDFGPDSPVHTLFFLGRLKVEDDNLQDLCTPLSKWVSVQSALRLLLEANPNDDRVGPLVAAVLSSDSSKAVKWKIPPMFHFQEYPPGICILPMKSRTAKPFRTTNLLIVTCATDNEDTGYSTSVTYGDALLVDPGCCSEFHAELADIVEALPKKLVVFITHHHYDHIDGLSVIQKCNPDAILLAHESTMNRIGKDTWSSGYTKVSDGDEIYIGDERLRVIFAPGHTDGHAALLHVSTNLLVVGDHCVGQGSAVLDVTTGGNMKDYFQTTYRFLELSPHAVLPMHGRLNLWPKRMLCGYLKHRRDRELSILNAIEGGAETLFDIVVKAYADVDAKFWIGASSNVRIHVDHLASQGKLPKEFSYQKFLRTCQLHFLSRWMWVSLKGYIHIRAQKLCSVKLLVALGFAGLALTYNCLRK